MLYNIKRSDCMNIKERGFTLAEVLITLGIIGVIAALTLPMLLAETKKIETSARLKKFVSTFQQAIMQSELVNGKASEWTQFRCSSGNNAICTNEEEEARGKAPEQFFNTYLKDYMKYLKAGSTNDVMSSLPTDQQLGAFIVYLNDGTTFSLVQGDCIDITFDTNGDRLPNVAGRDRFTFLLCNPDAANWTDGTNNIAFITYGGRDNATDRNRQTALNRCKSNARYCSYLLQMDNWEFKDDYPYKL